MNEKRKFFISKADYDSLLTAKNNNYYTNYICYVPCKLGKTKIFKVKDSEVSIELKCVQQNAKSTGDYCFVISNQ